MTPINDPHHALTFWGMETIIEEEEAFANMTLQEKYKASLGQAPRVIVIYHANCADGFSAAWVFHKAASLLNDTFEFVKGYYNEPPPDVSEAIVYLVDFSYKRQVVKDMIQLGGAIQVVLLDHHISAINDLEGLDDELEEEGFSESFFSTTDVEKSGARIAWEFWQELWEGQGINEPLLLDHIEDRDLWKFKLPLTEEISATISSYEYTFENWDMLMGSNIADKVALAESGMSISENIKKM